MFKTLFRRGFADLFLSHANFRVVVYFLHPHICYFLLVLDIRSVDQVRFFFLLKNETSENLNIKQSKKNIFKRHTPMVWVEIEEDQN